MEVVQGRGSSRGDGGPRGDVMLTPDEVSAMVWLHGLGWGSKRIAAELGCGRNTVKRYIAADGWTGYRKPQRQRRLDGLAEWLVERFRRHRGNCAVVRQDLVREHGLSVSLRTVERAVAPLRQAMRAEARACMRFETPPGKQLQIDFGERQVEIAGGSVRVYLFVATLGYSRRVYAQAFRHERQSAWFDGLEGAFRHFDGVPQEVLLDNPRACAPYRARTKGKDERGVGYVKGNAIAGHRFASWATLEAHLAWWMREIADVRVHGTTGEAPRLRFDRDEASTLKPLAGRPPFRQVRDLVRKVQSDCAIELDGNFYSVPWRLIGESVEVMVSAGRVCIRHGGQEVAAHAESAGRRQRILDPAHFHGVAGVARPMIPGQPALASPEPIPALLRPLAEYERAAGGSWS